MSASAPYDPKVNEAGEKDFLVRFVGGTAAVTKVTGPGVTVTWISTGVVDLTWGTNPGTFLGAIFGFQATTPADVKGHTCTPGVFNTSTLKLRLNITNASESLHDLAALEWLTCRVSFKDSATA